MQFSTTILAAFTAFAAIASAASVHFVNQDSTTRTIVFTASAGYAAINRLVIKGDATANQTFPTGWVGNWYSVSQGATNTNGMLGEVSFDGWGGMTYFDVSAIINPNDINGVKEIFPLNTGTPISGCQTFPCSNAYNKPDDIQTQTSTSDKLVCLIGNLGAKRSIGGKFARDFVTGKRSAEAAASS
ncbi:hypothetical protein NHQ30_001160 [Ciborinia camelliae]|nr:hypothetical protein NHQ30_001160 [Ciborinia camelliae]